MDHLEILGQDPFDIVRIPLHEMTQSAIHTFTQCPQKFALKYLLRLRRSGVSMPLLTGTAMHAGFELLFDPKITKPFEERLKDAENAVHAVFDEALESALLVPAMVDSMDQGRAQACAMIEAWWIINADDALAWQPVASELSIRATPYEEDRSYSMLERGAGKIDGIVLVEGRMLLLEHKSTSSLSFFGGSGLHLDGQVLWYMLLSRMLRNQLSELSDRSEIDGTLYNVIAKPAHRTPRNDFHGLKKKMIAAMIADPDKYFFVEPITVPESVLSAAFSSFTNVVNLMDTMTKSGTFYRNLKACRDFGGCEFVPLCSQGADVNNPAAIFDMSEICMYDVVEDAHGEL